MAHNNAPGTEISDARFITEAHAAYDQFSDAVTDHWNTQDVGPSETYDANESRRTLKLAAEMGKQFEPFITSRLDALAIRYLGSSQGDWQGQLLELVWELQRNPSPFHLYAGRVRQRHSQFVRLKKLVEIDAANATEMTPTAKPAGAGTNDLSDLPREILRTLFGKEAFDREHRLTTDEIARRIGNNTSPESVRGAMADVKEYYESVRGPQGGIWLNEQGKMFAQQL